MHATIENFTKGITVQAPSEWPTILRNARKNPEPYEIREMMYNEFLNFKLLCLDKSSLIKISAYKRVIISKESDLAKYSTSFLEEPINTFLLKIKNKSSIVSSCYKEELSLNKKNITT